MTDELSLLRATSHKQRDTLTFNRRNIFHIFFRTYKILRKKTYMEDPEEQRGESPSAEEGHSSKHRSLIRPHSAKGKKPSSRSSASSTPEPTVGGLRRPWSAHPKTRADVSKKKLVRDNLKRSHMRPPNRRQKPKDEETPAEGNEADDTQVIGLECAGLDYKPQRYKVRDESADYEAHGEDTLDHGVNTLVSGNIIRPVFI